MIRGESFVRKDEGTIVDVFFRWVKTCPRKKAILEKRGDEWKPITWAECGAKVMDLAFGLHEMGIRKGDRVAIFSENRVEWTYADLAILALGGVTVPIYATSSPEQARYILDHSGARMVYVNGPELGERVLRVWEELPHLERMVAFQPPPVQNSKILTLEELYRRGREARTGTLKDIDDLQGRVGLPDLATIIYTSGTTGPPKGCMLTHDNIIFISQSIVNILPVKRSDKIFSFLPLAHALERNGGQFTSIYFNLPTVYATSLDNVGAELQETKPTFSRAVPRFFEKAYNRVMVTVKSYDPRRRAIFEWALAVGKEYNSLRQEGKAIPLGLRFKRGLASLLVYRKIKRAMGGRMRFFVSGGAPLSKEIIEFFSALGVMILEGYGLTECTVVASLNRPDRFRFGSVGIPIPGAEIKLAPDGEIMIRHDGVFKGYYRNPEATEEVLDGEGWLKTGDIGYFDKDGFLYIADRKKDIIITAGGKNITPQNIENALKTHPLISQVMVYGDRMPYLVALITLDEESLPEQAPRYGIQLEPGVPPSRNQQLVQVIRDFVEEKGLEFSRVERIKKFRILDADFRQDLDELTPTLKVKRNVIVKRYREILESMYQEEERAESGGI